jgi:FkbM family methyltransferase
MSIASAITVPWKLADKPELWQRLPSAVLRKLRLRFAPPEAVITCPIRGGMRMELDLRDPISKAIYLYGCYEYPVTRLIEALIAPGMIFFDIGANAGFFSLLASARCRQVCAFEPLPSNLRRVRQNIEINRLKNVVVIENAVGDRGGSATLYVPEGDNSGLASLNPRPNARKIAVPVITLDHFVGDQGLERVDVMKIDIEGAEVLAFEGGRKLLSRPDAPDVIFEAHPGSDAANWLAGHGYRIYEFRLQREWEARNLFATKREPSKKVARQLK